MYTAVIQTHNLTCEAVPTAGEICAVNYIQIPQNLKVKRISIFALEDFGTGNTFPVLVNTKPSIYVSDYMIVEAAGKNTPPQGFKFEVTNPDQNITTGFYIASGQSTINEVVVVSILFEGEA